MKAYQNANASQNDSPKKKVMKRKVPIDDISIVYTLRSDFNPFNTKVRMDQELCHTAPSEINYDENTEKLSRSCSMHISNNKSYHQTINRIQPNKLSFHYKSIDYYNENCYFKSQEFDQIDSHVNSPNINAKKPMKESKTAKSSFISELNFNHINQHNSFLNHPAFTINVQAQTINQPMHIFHNQLNLANEIESFESIKQRIFAKKVNELAKNKFNIPIENLFFDMKPMSYITPLISKPKKVYYSKTAHNSKSKLKQVKHEVKQQHSKLTVQSKAFIPKNLVHRKSRSEVYNDSLGQNMVIANETNIKSIKVSSDGLNTIPCQEKADLRKMWTIKSKAPDKTEITNCKQASSKSKAKLKNEAFVTHEGNKVTKMIEADIKQQNPLQEEENEYIDTEDFADQGSVLNEAKNEDAVKLLENSEAPNNEDNIEHEKLSDSLKFDHSTLHSDNLAIHTKSLIENSNQRPKEHKFIFNHQSVSCQHEEIHDQDEKTYKIINEYLEKFDKLEAHDSNNPHVVLTEHIEMKPENCINHPIFTSEKELSDHKATEASIACNSPYFCKEIAGEETLARLIQNKEPMRSTFSDEKKSICNNESHMILSFLQSNNIILINKEGDKLPCPYTDLSTIQKLLTTVVEEDMSTQSKISRFQKGPGHNVLRIYANMVRFIFMLARTLLYSITFIKSDQ